MYNDYYLEQINNKIATTNTKIDELIENQQSIINNQVTLIELEQEDISGDNQIRANQTQICMNIVGLNLVLCLWLIYKWIERVMK